MTDPIIRLNTALEGRYRIERRLGEGGMATVYLADDLRHERKVALKVLKPELAAVVGADRFLAEIKTTATLHHPHILPLFDSGEADSFLFYVMPYVEGDTLKERIDREKQLPVEDATRIATAVAQALQHAHDRGVIHRDVKPANILFQDGQPLVSDFGIALAVGSAGGNRLTETGLSVGTPFYMSPEQATGDQHVGPPSDVYALAAVTYEMLTGDPPYMGSTAQAVLGQIIAGASVSATAKRRAVPAHVDAALRKALEKLPADRFASAQDFAQALGDTGFRYGDEAGVAAAGADLWKAVAAVLAVVALGATGIAAWSLTRPEEPGQVRRYELAFEPGSEPLPGSLIRAMPDGSGFMYVAARGQILRRWSDLEGVQVTSEGPAIFDLSPDGQEIALASVEEGDGTLRTESLSAGGGRRLTDVRAVGVWDWADDGWVYFTPLPTAPQDGMGISRVRADGSGDLEMVTNAAAGEAHVFAEVVPGGRIALFLKGRSSVADGEIWAVDLETRDSWLVTPGGVFQYAQSGHLLFVTSEGDLMAATFDPEAGEITRGPIQIVERLFSGAVGNYAFSVSPDGTLIYEESLGGGWAGTVEPIWVTRDGAAEVIDPTWSFDLGGVGETGASGWALSPDGTRVAVSVAQSTLGSDIWVKDLPAGAWDRLTQTEGAEAMPFWSPDGRFVGFTAPVTEVDETQLQRVRADGSGTSEAWLYTERSGFGNVQFRVTDDEEWFVARVYAPTGPIRDIVAFRADGDGSPIPLIATRDFTEQGADLSPDGSLIAYSSDETGREEVYVRPFPDVDTGRARVSLAGGRNPQWAHNGRELFFIDAEGRMNVAELEPGQDLRVARREILFTLESNWIGGGSGYGDGGDDLYDVDVGDDRFLMGRVRGTDTGTRRASRFIVVENWLEEFRDQLDP